MNFSKEQKDYIIHALEHCEVLTGGRSSGKTLELIKQQGKEIERLNNKYNKALEQINNYKIYCKENKGFTEYTDIEIEAIEPVISKLEDIYN